MASKQARSFRELRDEAHWEAVEDASELLVLRDFEAALHALKEVAQRDANNPYAYQLMGAAFWELEQYEPARDAYRAAVLLAPLFLAARVGLAHCHQKVGDLTSAEREARMALRQNDNDGEAHFVLGSVLAARGNRRQAKEHLERFLLSKPELESAMEARQMIAMLGEGTEGEPQEFVMDATGRPHDEDDDDDIDEDA